MYRIVERLIFNLVKKGRITIDSKIGVIREFNSKQIEQSEFVQRIDVSLNHY